MKGITVNIVKAFTIAHERAPNQKRKFKFQPKVKTGGPRPGGGRRRRRHMRPKR